MKKKVTELLQFGNVDEAFALLKESGYDVTILVGNWSSAKQAYTQGRINNDAYERYRAQSAYAIKELANTLPEEPSSLKEPSKNQPMYSENPLQIIRRVLNDFRDMVKTHSLEKTRVVTGLTSIEELFHTGDLDTLIDGLNGKAFAKRTPQEQYDELLEVVETVLLGSEELLNAAEEMTKSALEEVSAKKMWADFLAANTPYRLWAEVQKAVYDRYCGPQYDKKAASVWRQLAGNVPDQNSLVWNFTLKKVLVDLKAHIASYPL